MSWVFVAVVASAAVVWVVSQLLKLRSQRWRNVRSASEVSATAKRRKVCVVGGGIAGSACAYALTRSEVTVTLFEKKERVGGNANTHTFDLSSGDKVTCGLSVLAWPKRYFKSYEALLRSLDGGVKTEPVKLPFVVEVRSPEQKDAYLSLDHRKAGDEVVHEKFRGDLRAWERMLRIIRGVTLALTGGGKATTSLYKFSFLNPFNIIPLELFSKLFVSRAFWNEVVVPIYSSTFLTTNLTRLPCVIAPIMHDIVPLTDCPVLETWSGGSNEVFAKLLEGTNVIKGSPVSKVSIRSHGVEVETESGTKLQFDSIVFACDSQSALQMLERGTPSLPSSIRGLLGSVSYVDDDGPRNGAQFLEGLIHREADVLSENGKKCLDNASNFISVSNREGQYDWSNTFILSSWIPAVRHVDWKKEKPCLVTYGFDADNVKKSVARVDFKRAHPHFSFANLVISFLLPYFAQGWNKQQVFFCGSYTTPGNGHDLSLNSGLVVAHALGAAYPFDDDAEAKEDFIRVRKLMGL